MLFYIPFPPQQCIMLFYIPLPPSTMHHVILYPPSPLNNASCYSISPFPPQQCITLFYIPLPPSTMHHVILYPPSPINNASCYSISPCPPQQCIMLFYIPLPPQLCWLLVKKHHFSSTLLRGHRGVIRNDGVLPVCFKITSCVFANTTRVELLF